MHRLEHCGIASIRLGSCFGLFLKPSGRYRRHRRHRDGLGLGCEYKCRTGLGWWQGRLRSNRGWCCWTRGCGRSRCFRLIPGWCRFACLRSLAQQPACYSQCTLGLLNINRFRKNQVCPDAECFRDTCLSFDDGHGQRRLIRTGVTCAFEKQRGILLVFAIDYDGVEVLRH